MVVVAAPVTAVVGSEAPHLRPETREPEDLVLHVESLVPTAAMGSGVRHIVRPTRRQRTQRTRKVRLSTSLSDAP
jgi:hypothetical protein